MKTTTACLGALGALALFSVANSTEPDMRQVQCQTLIIYMPVSRQSDDDICAAFGGLAGADKNPERPSLTILIKNLPVGGNEGLQLAELSKPLK
ncbi:hypothetical protein [Breoghania sp. L-A4]|uniref:hypothetical protein n=1 Tax=Breoghania sp. L-A4 TaxID=2304600 RepID=UPI000E35AE94|nr:hypothetical protein [Breoghania sp. L-A4]AXS41180.1 hypothetical protein D1F64_15545 [Breoghania sp. L-A4]